MNEKILVVDDERELADLLEVYLKTTAIPFINTTMAGTPWRG